MEAPPWYMFEEAARVAVEIAVIHAHACETTQAENQLASYLAAALREIERLRGVNTANEYQQQALRTGSGKVTPGQAMAFGFQEGDKLPDPLQRLNWALGAAGEAGEIADLMKKQVFHDHPVDADKMLKEWGDLLWYVAVGAHWDGFTLTEVMDANIAKLRARYPEGFSPQASRERVS